MMHVELIACLAGTCACLLGLVVMVGRQHPAHVPGFPWTVVSEGLGLGAANTHLGLRGESNTR